MKNRDNYHDNDLNEESYDEYDEYERLYEEQLDRFSQMDGNDYSEDLDATDLEFHDPNDRYSSDRYNKTGNNRTNLNGSRTPVYPNRNRKSQNRQESASRSRNNQREYNRNLQFGANNSDKNRRSYNYKNARTNRMDTYDDYSPRKKSHVKRFFKLLFILIIILAVVVEIMMYRYACMVNSVETNHRSYTNASMYDDNVLNVLVIGSDSRSVEERGRTDTMMLLSIDKEKDKITMTSFMRDMYVEIPDNGWGKLNSANVYGGPELLMDTIELNFDVKVDKYIYIDFYSFVDIVDALGGIELDITDEEAEGMIPPMAEQNKIMGKPKGSDYLTNGGKNMTVNGNQALAYARLRYVGNADFERTERQRIVVSKIKEKALTFNPIKLNSFATATFSHITTNMTRNELFLLENRALFILGYDTEEYRIPEEEMYSYGWHDGQSTLDVDFDACRQALRNKIYS